MFNATLVAGRQLIDLAHINTFGQSPAASLAAAAAIGLCAATMESGAGWSASNCFATACALSSSSDTPRNALPPPPSGCPQRTHRSPPCPQKPCGAPPLETKCASIPAVDSYSFFFSPNHPWVHIFLPHGSSSQILFKHKKKIFTVPLTPPMRSQFLA